jgi:hypothetical protein
MPPQPMDRGRILALLVGSDELELSCEQCFDALDRYVDFEVAGIDAEARVPGMRAHLRGCPACADDHASLVQLAGRESDRE